MLLRIIQCNTILLILCSDILGSMLSHHDLSDINSIQEGLFRGCLRMGKKAFPP